MGPRWHSVKQRRSASWDRVSVWSLRLCLAGVIRLKSVVWLVAAQHGCMDRVCIQETAPRGIPFGLAIHLEESLDYIRDYLFQ